MGIVIPIRSRVEVHDDVEFHTAIRTLRQRLLSGAKSITEITFVDEPGVEYLLVFDKVKK